MKQKQLAKGIDQLMDEGVAQLFVNQFNGRKIIGTVGQLQFEVIQYRLLNEYNASCRWEPVSLYKACWVKAMILLSWKLSRNVNTNIWRKTGKDVTYSLPIQVMCFRWHKWTSSILNSTSQVNFSLLGGI